MKWKKPLRYLPLALCACFLWGFTALDLLTPDREESELENRTLAQAPQPSLRTLLNNTYAQRYETYVNDQFAGRDAWITIKSVSESVLGKLENNGVVYGADGYMFEKKLSLDTTQMLKNLDYMDQFARRYAGGPRLVFTVIPNSYAVLEDKLPAGLHNIDQAALIGEMAGAAGEAGWETVDILPALRERAGEYIYYRTDHHWTTYGAWLGYGAFQRHLGLTPVALDMLADNLVGDFYGTYYSKAKLYSATPDTITWYDIPGVTVEIDGVAADGLYDAAMFGKRDKYAAFLHGNNGLTVIRGGAGGAPGGAPSRILLLKDSYGNSMVPFLACSYDEVYVVDLRYYSDLHRLMEEVPFDQVYLLYNFDSFTSDVHLAKLQ